MTAYSEALRSAMTRRRVRCDHLAAVAGVTPYMLSRYRAGVVMPMLDVADRIAQALDAPHLLALVVAERTRECAECGRTFLAENKGGTARLFCQPRCQQLARYARERQRTLGRVRTWQKRYLRVSQVILAGCRACEPDGLCRDAGCVYRPASPFPLVAPAAVPLAPTGQRIRRIAPVVRTEERRAYKREWMRKARAAG